MFHVFSVIPTGFFNNLASGSNQKIYSDCIQLIYKEYEREISYRIPRNRIRMLLMRSIREEQQLQQILANVKTNGDVN